MTPFPIQLDSTFLGHWGAYVVYLIIGFGFGYVLEIAGFGKSTKLAAQFYFKEMTMLKVMFSAIIVAMVLIFLTSALGLLDYNALWVNPTYLWPGIVGGLIMGIGFIIGGFCPGTSLVSAATFRLDGIVFTLGVFFGIFVFGESVGLFESFFYSEAIERFTLPQLFGVDTGVVVVGVVIMALAAFALAEWGERTIGHGQAPKAPRWSVAAAGGLLGLAVITLAIGQPTNADRQARMAEAQNAAVADRAVQIHPGELLSYLNNRQIIPYLIDVRSETDYNAFHLPDAHHVPIAEVLALAPELRTQPANTLFVVMSNDETTATTAWRTLNAESVPNVYILEGGVNGWLDTFADDPFRASYRVADAPDEVFAYVLPKALGERYAFADPDPGAYTLEYTAKVTLQVRRAASGGCG